MSSIGADGSAVAAAATRKPRGHMAASLSISHEPIGCASRPRRTAELQLWERQLAGARSQPVEGRNSMRLDDRRELEGQLAAAEQRQSAPVAPSAPSKIPSIHVHPHPR